jgi:hypothetical protein
MGFEPSVTYSGRVDGGEGRVFAKIFVGGFSGTGACWGGELAWPIIADWCERRGAVDARACHEPMSTRAEPEPEPESAAGFISGRGPDAIDGRSLFHECTECLSAESPEAVRERGTILWPRSVSKPSWRVIRRKGSDDRGCNVLKSVEGNQLTVYVPDTMKFFTVFAGQIRA